MQIIRVLRKYISTGRTTSSIFVPTYHFMRIFKVADLLNHLNVKPNHLHSHLRLRNFRFTKLEKHNNKNDWTTSLSPIISLHCNQSNCAWQAPKSTAPMLRRQREGRKSTNILDTDYRVQRVVGLQPNQNCFHGNIWKNLNNKNAFAKSLSPISSLRQNEMIWIQLCVTASRVHA